MQNDIIVKQPPQSEPPQPEASSVSADVPAAQQPEAAPSVPAAPEPQAPQTQAAPADAVAAENVSQQPKAEPVAQTAPIEPDAQEVAQQPVSRGPRKPMGIIVAALLICILLIGLAVYATMIASDKAPVAVQANQNQAQSLIEVDNTNPAQLADETLKGMSNNPELPNTADELSNSSLGL